MVQNNSLQALSGFVFILLGAIIGCFGVVQPQAIILSSSFGLSAIGAIIIALCKKQDDQESSVFLMSLTGLLMLYVLYLCFNVTQSEIVYYSMTSFAVYAAIPLIGLVLLLNPAFFMHHGESILKIMVWCFTPFAMWALVQFFYFSDIFHYHAAHPLPNSNVLGCLFGVMALISLGLFFTQIPKTKASIIYGLLFLLYGLGVIATGSSGALLATLLALLLFFLIVGGVQQLRLIPSFLLGGILYGAFLIFNRVSSGQVSSLYHSTLHGRSYNERWLIWQQAIEMIKDAPLWGYGIGTYSAILPQYRTIGDQSSGFNAHSDYLHMGVEIGVIGLGLYLTIILFTTGISLIYLYKTLIKNDTANPQDKRELTLFAGILAAIFAFLVQAAFSSLSLTLPLVIIISILSAYCWSALNTASSKIDMSEKSLSLTKAVTIIAALFLTFIYISVHLSSYAVHRAADALKREDIAAFDHHLQRAEQLSFGQNPHVYALSAELPFAMIIADPLGTMDQDQRDTLLQRLNALHTASLSLASRNAALYYKKALIAQHLGQNDQAIQHLKTSLEINPLFLDARLHLADHYKEKGLMSLYEQILFDGAHWTYAQHDPRAYFKSLLLFDDKTLSEHDLSREYLNEQITDIDRNLNKTKKMLGLLAF